MPLSPLLLGATRVRVGVRDPWKERRPEEGRGSMRLGQLQGEGGGPLVNHGAMGWLSVHLRGRMSNQALWALNSNALVYSLQSP